MSISGLIWITNFQMEKSSFYTAWATKKYPTKKILIRLQLIHGILCDVIAFHCLCLRFLIVPWDIFPNFQQYIPKLKNNDFDVSITAVIGWYRNTLSFYQWHILIFLEKSHIFLSCYALHKEILKFEECIVRKLKECLMGRWEIADKDNEKLSHHKGFRGINCSANENFFG